MKNVKNNIALYALIRELFSGFGSAERNLTANLQTNRSFRVRAIFAAFALIIFMLSIQNANAAAITVNSLSDAAAADGVCTLREAITNANNDNQSGSVDCAAGSGADTISITAAGTINLLSALPTLTTDMTINGLGSANTTVRRDGGAATEFRIFTKTAGTATLSGMTIRDGIVRGANGTNGVAVSGGGVSNQSSPLTLSNVVITNNQVIGGNGTNGVGGNSFGGGILNDNNAPLTITDSTVSGNFSTGGNGTTGGGIGQGGGINTFDAGGVTIINSVISGNTATGGTGTTNGDASGGGIGYFGILNLSGSTVSGNTVSGNSSFAGGGIDGGGTVNVTNSTISGNTVTGTGGNTGGGIAFFGGTVTLTNATITNNTAAGANSASGVYRDGGTINSNNTIIAANVNNSTVPDVSGAGFVSQGYNLIGNVGTVTAFNQTGDQTGTSAAPLDPNLGPLQNNGGTTQTHALLAGSIAIDTGNSTLTTDQRGFMRPIDDPNSANGSGNLADIGAFEVQAPTAASVSVSGRVRTPHGKGLINAFVTLTDSTGNRRLARTTAFGYFHFQDVAAGETYIVGVLSKRYRFTPQVLSINQNIADLELTGEEILFKSLR